MLGELSNILLLVCADHNRLCTWPMLLTFGTSSWSDQLINKPKRQNCFSHSFTYHLTPERPVCLLLIYIDVTNAESSLTSSQMHDGFWQVLASWPLQVSLVNLLYILQAEHDNRSCKICYVIQSKSAISTFSVEGQPKKIRFWLFLIW